MVTRRTLLAAPLAAPLAMRPGPAFGQADFALFLDGVRREARQAGVRPAVLDEALRGIRPNPKVIELDHHQPEFTLTWAQYRARVLPDARIATARRSYAAHAAMLADISARYPADPRIVVGIWGLESDFGAKTGHYGIVEALATLAYEGRRAGYFRAELINALRILEHGDIAPAAMTGSWAGAMGQPQFMPSSYLRYAVDADGDGRRDIWGNQADIFGSIANYLARSGWRQGEPWVQPVTVPPGLSEGETGRERMRSLGAWEERGVRRGDGRGFSRHDVQGAVLLPDGAGGEAFMVYPNFNAIRRYNPSDFYALGVGLLGNAAA